MNDNLYFYFLVAALSIYLLRSLPITLLQKPIKNTFIRSFLYYIPYVTLSIMAFPAILSATQSVYSAVAGLVAACLAAYIDGNLFKVSAAACCAVFLVELFL